LDRESVSIGKNSEKEFYVYVIGLWGSGKSSFLNALSGRKIIPVRFLPSAAIPTYVRWNKKGFLEGKEGIDDEVIANDEAVLTVKMGGGDQYILAGDGIGHFERIVGFPLPRTYDELICYLHDNAQSEFDEKIMEEGEKRLLDIAEIHISLPERAGFEHICMIEKRSLADGETFGQDGWIERADAVIFLSNVTQGFTSSSHRILKAMYKHKPQLAEDAIIVLSCVDIVDRAGHGREKILQGYEKVVKEIYHQLTPRIFPACLPAVLDNSDSGEKWQAYAEEFSEAADKIMADIRGRLLERNIKEAFRSLPEMINSLSRNEQELYAEKLEALRKSFNDPEFRLAVIGNFSCGKSTFLNALLGQELLSTSALPTTAMPTYIRWDRKKVLKRIPRNERFLNNTEPIVVVTMESPKKYVLPGIEAQAFWKETGIQLPDGIGELIDYITTTNSLIGKIKKIDISFPEREEFINFCLIDTPGVNPGDEESKEHIVQTQMVLREEADAAIVLYTAKDAMARDTRQFMEENGMRLMENAIVVLTKMDLVPQKQAEKVMRNTVWLVKEQFRQKKPRVYGISAGKAIEFGSGRSGGEEDKRWFDEFNRTVCDIIRQLRERRLAIVSRKFAVLMTEIIQSVSEGILRETAKLGQEKELLEKASVDKLWDEFHTINAAYEENMKDDALIRKLEAKSIVRSLIERKKNAVCEKIDAAKNQKELNHCLKEDYPNTVKGIDQEIIEKINIEVISEINKNNQEYIKKVEGCLDKCSRYLGKINTYSTGVKGSIISKTSINMDLSTDSSSLEEHTALLTAIGTSWMLPGLNLLVLAAGIFGDYIRFNSKKEEAKTKVKQNFETYEKQLIEACQESVRQVESKNLQWAKTLLDQYKAKYKEAFERIEQEYERHFFEVQGKIKKNKENIQEMQLLEEGLEIKPIG